MSCQISQNDIDAAPLRATSYCSRQSVPRKEALVFTSAWGQRRWPSCSVQFLVITVLILLLAQVQPSDAQFDPVKNFCRRFGHQTALIDRKLYIDGGMVNFGSLSQYPTNYSNAGLLFHDLDKNGTGGMPELVAGKLSKNSTVPSVSGGTLWTDDINKRFYLFGGEHNQQPAAPPIVPQYVLWSYDVLNDQWDSLGPPTGADVGGVAYGAGATISERGEGFYYGGWKSNSSVPGWNGPPSLTTGMVRYTMASNDWRNYTGPDSLGRAEGSMVFLPISDGGMLVYLGGVKQGPGSGGNSSLVGQGLDEILLYDVLSSSWYKQKATGQVPQMRRRFCAGATWAQDQSSYNIYIYGGAGMEPDTSGFDDVYILTIPSFQWIKMYPDDGNVTGSNPHHSLTCNVVDHGQMLILGGTFPTSDTCDYPEDRGLHNLYLGDHSSEKAGWHTYRPNLTTYAVPDLVTKAIGGSGGGGATKTIPDQGFNHRNLRVLMTRKANLPTRTATRAIPTATGATENSSSPISTGAIAGIAVGGAAVLAGILGSCWFIRRHRRRRRRLAENAPSGPWGPQTANVNAGAGQYSPSSTHQRSPFIQRHPVELPVEPPPGVSSWLGPDGVTYELVTSPNFAATGSNTINGGSIAGTGTGTGTAAGTIYSNHEPQTKIDSEGRLWVQVSPSPGRGGSVVSGAGSPGEGGRLGLGLYATNGTGATGGYSPVASGGGGSPHTPRTPVGYAPSPLPQGPPQELGSEPRREGDVVPHALLGEGSGWDAAHGRPRHDTYYHP
ncbi:autophagy-related protein 3 [Podospora australis]|uniref:Autophagy-related protein 3 n=1 Tax=Podospora australis TaxID=1536484 RepID=A0AAN7AK24_9PEZI|nr:autophagy-related protein 3 [Podospora australis]